MKKSKNKGITLIALVMTIIILLILAAITIGQVTKNGLFNKAQEVKDETIIKEAEEEINLIVIEVQTGKLGKATLEDVVEALRDKTDEYMVEIISEKTANVDLNDNGKDIKKAKEIKVINKTKYDGIEVIVTDNLEVAALTENGSEETHKFRYNINIETLNIPDTIEVKKGETINIDYKPSREGYKFLGWSKDKDDTSTENIITGTNQTITMGDEDITLYAVWSKNEDTPKELEWIKIGTYNSLQSRTVDIKGMYKDYQKITKDNFVLKNVKEEEISAGTNSSAYSVARNQIISSYDSVNGKISLSYSTTRNYHNNSTYYF